jgi:hypothetical protein
MLLNIIGSSIPVLKGWQICVRVPYLHHEPVIKEQNWPSEKNSYSAQVL